ncbi:zinc-ribbon domain containing protein [Vibrio parahaemolyticus]|nr:zinc-ribbon domain containing protein [Vibrio parahaemolyticus]ELA8111210.1 zinc-ribbon domain containing protein [Vibrio parahaemolyticus]ELA8164942.1 zinc-ribbon domain containing protein [Vibrio parahaemolyticus]
MGRWKKRKKSPREPVPVDKEKWGANDNTYAMAPDFYYNKYYKCCDCGKEEVWTAENQKYWYEDLGKTINSHAIRCQVCRAHILALKEEQKRHMEEMANKLKHPNEKFFKSDT